jgi:hypothetical protein
MRSNHDIAADFAAKAPARARAAHAIKTDVQVIAKRSVDTWHTYELAASEVDRCKALEDGPLMDLWCDAVYALGRGDVEVAYEYLSEAAVVAHNAGVSDEPEQSALAYFTDDDD